MAKAHCALRREDNCFLHTYAAVLLISDQELNSFLAVQAFIR